MGDDRYNFVHESWLSSSALLDEDRLPDMPTDDIQVPYHLLPPYQDEDDESILPSAAHPSYPYGNPYAPRSLPSKTSSTLFRPHSSISSLATSLPVLNLPNLHSLTTFGDARDRTWNELGLDELLDPIARAEGEDEPNQGQAGDGGEPSGQNAGDEPSPEAQMDEE
ncbi:hypothetical protein T439DRAFT_325743 [Meredithblackwellia eburnea MCA 4105]